MTSTFSFHCIVCFDDFNNAERHPVVLPCGHTYICAVCTEKIDKCMECRASLWTTSVPHHDTMAAVTPAAADAAAAAAAFARSRYARRASWSGSSSVPLLDGNNQKKKMPVQRRRLSTPKNMVLLSLIETTAIMETNIEKKRSLSNESLDVTDLIEKKQEEHAKLGTELLTSDCGTYAVVAQKGLEIYPQEADADEKLSKIKSKSMNKKTDLIRVNHGNQLQVVSIEDGWAKLARGYGRVRAGASNLVKVGCFKDKACGIEGMLHISSKRRRSLHEDEKRLESNLHDSLLNDHDITVAVRDLLGQEKDEVEEEFPPPALQLPLEIGDEHSSIIETFLSSPLPKDCDGADDISIIVEQAPAPSSVDCSQARQQNSHRQMSLEGAENSYGHLWKKAISCFAPNESDDNTIPQAMEKRCTPSTLKQK